MVAYINSRIKSLEHHRYFSDIYFDKSILTKTQRWFRLQQVSQIYITTLLIYTHFF